MHQTSQNLMVHVVSRSVGATVMQMATGKRPFHEYSREDIKYSLGKRALPLEKLISAPEYSDEVKKFLHMCIVW